MSLNIKGVIVPMLTPFDEQGSINPTATEQLVGYLITRGVAGLFPAGTTGEGPLLNRAERRQLAEIVVNAAAGRVPVIVHTGAITTRETIELTQHARQVGAEAAAIIPPYYFHHSDKALFHHFMAVAQSVPDFPIYLYNNPGVGNHNQLSIRLISQIIETCPNIIGVKDSSGSLNILIRLKYIHNERFNTASGGDGMILQGVTAGVDACVSGNANVVPELVVALHRAATEGNMAQARHYQKQLDFVRDLLEDGRDLSLFKAMMAQRGLSVGTVRAPLQPVSESVAEHCWQTLGTMDLQLVESGD